MDRKWMALVCGELARVGVEVDHQFDVGDTSVSALGNGVKFWGRLAPPKFVPPFDKVLNTRAA